MRSFCFENLGLFGKSLIFCAQLVQRVHTCKGILQIGMRSGMPREHFRARSAHPLPPAVIVWTLKQRAASRGGLGDGGRKLRTNESELAFQVMRRN